jgi:hypothetical protein
MNLAGAGMCSTCEVYESQHNVLNEQFANGETVESASHIQTRPRESLSFNVKLCPLTSTTPDAPSPIARCHYCHVALFFMY